VRGQATCAGGGAEGGPLWNPHLGLTSVGCRTDYHGGPPPLPAKQQPPASKGHTQAPSTARCAHTPQCGQLVQGARQQTPQCGQLVQGARQHTPQCGQLVQGARQHTPQCGQLVQGARQQGLQVIPSCLARLLAAASCGRWLPLLGGVVAPCSAHRTPTKASCSGCSAPAATSCPLLSSSSTAASQRTAGSHTGDAGPSSVLLPRLPPPNRRSHWDHPAHTYTPMPHLRRQ